MNLVYFTTKKKKKSKVYQWLIHKINLALGLGRAGAGVFCFLFQETSAKTFVKQVVNCELATINLQKCVFLSTTVQSDRLKQVVFYFLKRNRPDSYQELCSRKRERQKKLILYILGLSRSIPLCHHDLCLESHVEVTFYVLLA